MSAKHIAVAGLELKKFKARASWGSYGLRIPPLYVGLEEVSATEWSGAIIYRAEGREEILCEFFGPTAQETADMLAPRLRALKAALQGVK